MTGNRMSVTIEFKAIPFARDPPNAEPFYAAVGRFVRVWSEFEILLDYVLGMIAAMPEWAEERGKRKDVVPTPMSGKAAMWRDAFRSLPRLEPARERALRFMSDAMDTHDDRTLILHGRWLRFTNSEPLTVELERRKRQGRKILVYGGENTIHQIEAATSEAADLTARLTPIMLFLVGLPRPKAPDKP
jgi:hypothetical protein